MTQQPRAWPLLPHATPAPRIYPGALQAAQALARPENPGAVLRALVQTHGLGPAQRILDEMHTELTVLTRAAHRGQP